MQDHKKKKIVSSSKICANCMDFDAGKNTCTIRYVIDKDKVKNPMPRRPDQKGCEVFMMKLPVTTNAPG